MTTLAIAVCYQGNTYHARILTRGKAKFTATCTSGDLPAAQAVVHKFYGAAAAATVRKFDCAGPCAGEVSAFNASPQRKSVFNFYEFDAP
jgi:hypothetical protein